MSEQTRAKETELVAGETVAIDTRWVRVVSSHGKVLRDFRGRVAVRNFITNRLSYVQEWRLLKSKRAALAAGKER